VKAARSDGEVDVRPRVTIGTSIGAIHDAGIADAAALQPA